MERTREEEEAKKLQSSANDHEKREELKTSVKWLRALVDDEEESLKKKLSAMVGRRQKP